MVVIPFLHGLRIQHPCHRFEPSSKNNMHPFPLKAVMWPTSTVIGQSHNYESVWEFLIWSWGLLGFTLPWKLRSTNLRHTLYLGAMFPWERKMRTNLQPKTFLITALFVCPCLSRNIIGPLFLSYVRSLESFMWRMHRIQLQMNQEINQVLFLRCSSRKAN